MNKYTGTVILTYGRGLMTVVAARSLAERGIRVITCDSVGLTAASFSKHVRGSFTHSDYEDEPQQYFRDMLSNIEKFRPDGDEPYVLMPMFRDSVFLAEHSKRLEGRITLAAPSLDAIQYVHPKQNLVRTLKTVNVAAPKTWHPETEEQLENALSEISLPALVKAVDDVGGRGIDFFKDRVAFERCARERFKTETPTPLLQETAEGKDYCLCVLYQNGERLAHMAYTNLQTMPSDGGAGAMRETIDDTPFLEASDTIMKAANWTGVAEIDFMWTGDPADEPLMIEVNPRFWAGLFQSVESGVDFPWLVYQLATTGTVSGIPKAEVGTRTKVPGAWLAGGLADAFKSREGRKVLVWEDMISDAKEGDFAGVWDQLKTALSDATNFDDAIALLRRQSQSAKTAKSELMLDDDPAISLGVFYVLSSLARHGELPAELK